MAALTLPTLLSNVQDKILENQAKKAANIIANGYKLMMANNETFNVANLPLWQCEDEKCTSKVHKAVFNIADDSPNGFDTAKLPTNYASSKQKTLPLRWTDVTYYTFATVDGFVYGIVEPRDWNNVTSIDIIADVNGSKNPNVVKKDLFKYRFSGEGGQLYDVTNELEEMTECSVQNLSACTTKQQCYSIGEQCRATSSCAITYWDHADESCHCECVPY